MAGNLERVVELGGEIATLRQQQADIGKEISLKEEKLAQLLGNRAAAAKVTKAALEQMAADTVEPAKKRGGAAAKKAPKVAAKKVVKAPKAPKAKEPKKVARGKAEKATKSSAGASGSTITDGIVKLLNDHPGQAFHVSDVAEHLSAKVDSIRTMMKRLAARELIAKAGPGEYCAKLFTTSFGVSPHTKRFSFL
jgi:hypothetical protein